MSNNPIDFWREGVATALVGLGSFIEWIRRSFVSRINRLELRHEKLNDEIIRIDERQKTVQRRLGKLDGLDGVDKT